LLHCVAVVLMDFAVFCAQIRDQQAPKATVTVYLKRLEAAGFVRREIDPSDLRRHRLLLTPAGCRATTDGLALLSNAFNERLGRLTVA
jgi:MarR family transcriptional regulator, temperature-dependent positive regulator of motility